MPLAPARIRLHAAASTGRCHRFGRGANQTVWLAACLAVVLQVGTAQRAGAADAVDTAAAGQPVTANAAAVNAYTIEALTPDEARKLVASFPGQRVSCYVADGPDGRLKTLKHLVGLGLDGLKALDAATAECLAAYGEKGPLSLRRLTAIDTATARALAKFGGTALALDGLTTLPAETAAALADFQGDALFLQGLKSLDVPTAEALAKYRGQHLYLNPSVLSPDVAQALAAFRGATLSIGGVSTIDAAVAKALAGFEGQELRLPSLKSLNADAARALAESTAWDGRLNALETVDAETARTLLHKPGLNVRWRVVDESVASVLAEHEGNFLSIELAKPSAATARALAQFKGAYLTIRELQTMDADTARAFAGFRGKKLSFHHLTELSGGSAEALANCAAWDGSLRNVRAIDATSATALVEGRRWDGTFDFDIDEATARVLARHTGDDLNVSLKTLSLDTARALAGFKGRKLHIRSLRSLDAATAAALAEFQGQQLDLQYLTALDAATAEALAAFAGEQVLLPALSALDAATARALAAFGGERVLLPALAALDDDAVTALADVPGHPLAMPQILATLGRELPLTPETARLVCATEAPALLTHVTAFDSPDSVEIATALAAARGPLALPNLKKISPKTLTALIQKKDVRIPLVETLELIPEPDGSPTEDFVIPEGFQQ